LSQRERLVAANEMGTPAGAVFCVRIPGGWLIADH